MSMENKKRIKAWAIVNKNGNLIWLMNEPLIGTKKRIKSYDVAKDEKIVPCEIKIYD